MGGTSTSARYWLLYFSSFPPDWQRCERRRKFTLLILKVGRSHRPGRGIIEGRICGACAPASGRVVKTSHERKRNAFGTSDCEAWRRDRCRIAAVQEADDGERDSQRGPRTRAL